MMSIPFFILIIILCISVFYDIRYRRIPNWLTLPAIVFGLGYHLITGGLDGLGFSALGMVVGFGFFFLFYVAGGMGAGDVKLMAAIGSILGPKDAVYACAYTAIAGGVYALILILAGKENRKAFTRYGIMAKALLTTGHFASIPRDENIKTTPLCYGVAIAAGTIILIVQKIVLH
jgi:prepilin peptidase CpaA